MACIKKICLTLLSGEHATMTCGHGGRSGRHASMSGRPATFSGRHAKIIIIENNGMFWSDIDKNS